MVLIQATSNGMHTRFELYDSEGILVKAGGNGGSVKFEDLKFQKGGQYTLFVMDNGGNNTGSFELTLQR